MDQKARMRRKKKVLGTAERPRLVVYRSLRHIYGQIINDVDNRTLCGVSDLSPDVKAQVEKAKSKVEASAIIGEALAKKAIDAKVEQVAFDRNGYKYHGRVKALADGARKGGLKF